MSLGSPPFADDDVYDGSRRRSASHVKTVSSRSTPTHLIDNHIIQEVSLSYSEPYTAVARHTKPLAVHISNGNTIEEYSKAYEENGNLGYIDDYNRVVTKKSPPRRLESFERVFSSGRTETEFPSQQIPYTYVVKRYGTEEIPYFSAQSAIQSARTTPAHTPRQTPVVDSRASTVRLPSSLSHSTVISESTTIEELTTITTTNSRTTRTEKTSADMPTVNALTEQFEETARREKKEALRSKSSPNSKSNTRVVVINRPNQYSPTYGNQVRQGYFPANEGSIVTTTIVDIEPPGYGRRAATIEEYRMEEEYHMKTYGGAPRQQARPSEDTRSREEAVEIFVRSHSRGAQGRGESPTDTSQTSPSVKNVIEHFETRFEEKVKPSVDKENIPRDRPTSRSDYGTRTVKEVVETKEIYIPKREVTEDVSDYTKWYKRPTEVPPSPPVQPTAPVRTQPDFIRTYEEERHMITRRDGTVSSESRIAVSEPPPETIETQKPPPVPTTPPPEDEPVPPRKEKTVIVTKEDTVRQQETAVVADLPKTDIAKLYEQEEEPETTSFESEEMTRRSRLDREYRLQAYEELLTTTRRRDRSLPTPYRREITERVTSAAEMPVETSSYTSKTYHHRTSSSVDRLSDSHHASGTRYYGEVGYGTGRISGSGLASGGLCTVAIRDAREREKREIGILNDRLADYIEKVRFLEAQNRVLFNDIDHLRKGLSGSGVSFLYENEIKSVKSVISETLAARGRFTSNVEHLTTEVNGLKSKWLEIFNQRKSQRHELDADLDKLAQIEAEISLFKRKIAIVQEQCDYIKHENQKIYATVSRVKADRDREISIRYEYNARVQDLLARVKHFASDNEHVISQELRLIRTDTTAANRDYFRHELQAAMREIRVEYERVSRENQIDLDRLYRVELEKIENEYRSSHYDHTRHREEVIRIRSTISDLRSRLAELESRNLLLEKQISDLSHQAVEDTKLYEVSLAEKDKAIQRMRAECTSLTVELEKVCDHQISLHKEIEHYRRLLEGAHVNTHYSSVTPGYSAYGSAGSTTGVTTSVTKTSYSVGGGVSAGGHHIVGGNIGISSSGLTAGVTKKPDRVHDETGIVSGFGNCHRWYIGTIRITEVKPEYIELENICIIRRVNVGGMKIVHRNNDVELGSATINGDLILDPKQTLRIYAAETAPSTAQFTIGVNHFETSSTMKTSLYNIDHEERAWFVYTD